MFQIEYAQKAVENSGTSIAIRGKDGVVFAVEKIVTSKGVWTNSIATPLSILMLLPWLRTISKPPPGPTISYVTVLLSY